LDEAEQRFREIVDKFPTLTPLPKRYTGGSRPLQEDPRQCLAEADWPGVHRAIPGYELGEEGIGVEMTPRTYSKGQVPVALGTTRA
jgi:hypothetical protein